MSNRTELLGRDRDHRMYLQLGGRHGAGELLLQDEGGAWSRLVTCSL